MQDFFQKRKKTVNSVKHFVQIEHNNRVIRIITIQLIFSVKIRTPKFEST